MLPDKFVEQQAGGADDNQDEGGGFQEVSHISTLIIAYFSMLSFPTPAPFAIGGASPHKKVF